MAGTLPLRKAKSHKTIEFDGLDEKTPAPDTDAATGVVYSSGAVAVDERQPKPVIPTRRRGKSHGDILRTESQIVAAETMSTESSDAALYSSGAVEVSEREPKPVIVGRRRAKTHSRSVKELTKTVPFGTEPSDPSGDAATTVYASGAVETATTEATPAMPSMRKAKSHRTIEV
jgi:hypothetical protein